MHELTLTATPAAPRPRTAADYLAIRGQTTALCAPLEIEDYGPQSMPDASPAKWHLAHTTWFFERFVLRQQLPHYPCFHPQFDLLFNSYYDSVGPQQPRHARGLLSRPTVEQVLDYRAHVDEHMQRLLEIASPSAGACHTIEVGLQHEQQHQELLLTDVKHLLFANPLRPPYRIEREPPREARGADAPSGSAPGWQRHVGGEHQIGADPEQGFCFDNELPRHRRYTAAFALAARPVSNEEFRQFVRADGYRRASLWLADGWQTAQSQGWQRPLYWGEDLESEFTLGGVMPLDLNSPVCHVSYYEADAYARWAGKRLPTEQEWEWVAARQPVRGNLLESGALAPRAADPAGGQTSRPQQLFGDVWEWTASAYLPYPGYRPWPDALGEYNGKFMANQFVLRGGSCATPRSHIRASYRNFFYPAARWQFSGLRLAEDT